MSGMTYRELRRIGVETLQKAGVDAPAFEISVLFEDLADIPKEQFPLLGGEPVPPEIAEKLLLAVKRRAEGYPLQYLVGSWWFYGRKFAVGEGVLIPREETELLCEMALRLLEHEPEPKVADLCSGTGCVGITIAKERPDAGVFAYELSEDALFYLRKNIFLNGAPNVRAFQADVLLPPEEDVPVFDLIACNPPYIRSGEIPSLQPELSAEPYLALSGGEDGLDFYRAIVRNWPEKLRSGGYLIFEMGEEEGPVVIKLLKDAGFTEISVYEDLTGFQREISAKKP